MQQKLDKELEILANLLGDISKDTTVEIHAYQKIALKRLMEHTSTKTENPMVAYFELENWLYEQKEKPIETKAAMLWGGLWVVNHMKSIDWDTMRTMYGEFMSKQMGLR